MSVNTKKIFPKSFMAFVFSERQEESKVERLPVNLMSPTYKKKISIGSKDGAICLGAEQSRAK
jgi:isocitrate dehydrogenase kinase/phosphatase